MRAIVHLAAALAVIAVAFAFGRWLRDPAPAGALVVLLGATLVLVAALRRLYRPGGLGRAAKPAAAPPEPAPAPDDRIDLNTASVAELQRLPGIGAVAAGRIVDEREAGGPYRTVGDLARVAGFGPSRVRSLAARVKV